MIGRRAARKPSIRRRTVGTILASGRTSLPNTEPKPPSSTKSRCMSMTISASLPTGKLYS
jgi:hypothetical protein